MLQETISIIIPAYNEESGIGRTLDHILNVTKQFGMENSEIIVINDGSQDKTTAIVNNYEGITLISHQQNRGYGAALKTGIRQAKNDIIVIIDADSTYPAAKIYDLYFEMKQHNADMVIGARIGENVNIPIVRRPAKLFLRKFASFVAETKIPDLNSGLRLFKKEIALVFFDILPNQFSFTTTITLAMLVNGYHVRYLPIDYTTRKGKSKIKPIRDTLNFTQLIFRIALYFNPMRIFLPLSFALFIFGIVWGFASVILLGRFADASTIMIIMTGLQVLSIGLLAELINKRTPNTYR